MATQALYRRYRPQRFSEMRGQEHVVKALRNAVIAHREGQAYLFSGPRGTGKTTSARILAKVLNCERPVDGEPCCECDSCIAVQSGTSYDVFELDAASNNGVDAMRDLIEKAALGTPGRHKVYILDEVHMLSKAAEAALLKTLEEPPPHVVFVLATTDPQKVSDTIRSRTQHLRFHLLPIDELDAHVRWIVDDAGLQVSDAAIEAALVQGAGSARDTLSALELIASTGGDDIDAVPYDEFVEALVDLDPGRAITAVAMAVRQGRDARTLTEDIVRHLRDCFLSLMAPELVVLPDARATVVAEQAQRLGAARTVKAMERLGETLVEMRHAPDARLLLEVALVQLTHQAAATDVASLADRLDRVERTLASGPPAVTPTTSGPVDPATGRVAVGGRARPVAPRTPDSPTSPAPAPAPAQRDGTGASTPGTPGTPATPATPGTPAPSVADEQRHEPPVPAALAAPADGNVAAAARWAEVLPTLRPLVRAIYSVPRNTGVRDGALVLAAPNEAHRVKCEQHRADVERAAADVVGGAVSIRVIVDHADTAPAAFDDRGGDADERADPAGRSPATPAAGTTGGDGPVSSGRVPTPEAVATRNDHPVVHATASAVRAVPDFATLRAATAGEVDPVSDHLADVVPLRREPVEVPTPDDEIDLDDLVDAPPGDVLSPIERVQQAFPGSELLDERR
jgi:DNA polymerase-3 subunit gamma/tau